MSACSDFEDLLFTTGAPLSAAEEAALRAHLDACEDCRDIRAVMTPEQPDFDELPEIDEARYEVLFVEAEGGMGRVVRAWDRRLHRTVMMKAAREPAGDSKLEQEARLTADLEHPSIVSVHEAGRRRSDGRPVYVMKLVEGKTLDQCIAERATLPRRLELLPAFIAAAQAIAYAHGRDVIHRDIKPQNIQIGAFGESVVLDWGIAKRTGQPEVDGANGRHPPSDAPYTLGAGTPPYMPPEQAQAHEPDARSDVYALGATLYHLLAGRPPYANVPPEDLTRRLLAGPPAPLRSTIRREGRYPPGKWFRRRVPPELRTIVSRAMARDPAERFPTAREMVDELVRFQTGQAVTSHKYSFREMSRLWWRRTRGGIKGRFALAAAVALVVLALAGLTTVFVQRSQARRTAAALLVEQGRLELLQGHPDRAFVFLYEAQRQGADSAAVYYLTAAASSGSHGSTDVPVAKPVVPTASGSPRALSRDGRWEAIAAEDGQVVVRNAHSEEVLAWLPPTESGPVLEIAFTADGALLATSSADEAHMWDWQRSAVLHVMKNVTARSAAKNAKLDDRSLLELRRQVRKIPWKMESDGRLVPR